MLKLQNKSFKDLIQDRLHNRITGAGLQVFNADGPKATLRIYDEIGFFGITAEDVASALEEVTADELEVQISSLGGDVFDGVAIFNSLRAHPARVTTRVDSMAASIASVIAQAGDERVMLSGSQMMIHEAWGLAIGNAGEMRKLADVLDKQTDVIAGIYAEAADGEASGFRDLMVAESWMDADEAVDAGLADVVVKPSERPADRWHNKFSDEASSVLDGLRRFVDRAEEVVTFRSEQGKKPLSEEAVAFKDEMAALVGRLDAVASEPEEKEEEPSELVDELEKIRFEWEGKRYLEGVS